jgi:hypothetical protein
MPSELPTFRLVGIHDDSLIMQASLGEEVNRPDRPAAYGKCSALALHPMMSCPVLPDFFVLLVPILLRRMRQGCAWHERILLTPSRSARRREPIWFPRHENRRRSLVAKRSAPVLKPFPGAGLSSHFRAHPRIGLNKRPERSDDDEVLRRSPSIPAQR